MRLPYFEESQSGLFLLTYMKTRVKRYARYRKKIQSLPDRKFPLEGRFGKSSAEEVSKVMSNVLAKETISFNGKAPVAKHFFAQSEQRERYILLLKVFSLLGLVAMLIVLLFCFVLRG